MEKVKLTEEQAEAIENIKENAKGNLIEWFLAYRSVAAMKPLYLLTIDTCAQALYIGYEIEPEHPKFQPGDKVVRVDGREFANFEKIGCVYQEEDNGQIVLLKGPKGYRDTVQQWTPDIIRHATPEEIYWLETLGREKVGDFRVGDIFLDAHNTEFLLHHNADLKDAEEWYRDSDFKGIYPAESFKPFLKEQSNER